MKEKKQGYYRGLGKELFNKLEGSKLMNEIKNPSNNIFLGIRNKYFNLYYQCASMGKFEYLKKEDKWKITIADKYMVSTMKDAPWDIDDFITNYKMIQENINNLQSGCKEEKIAQQRLIQRNNSSSESEWFCVDLEYVQARKSKAEPAFGRFDVVAVSKKKKDEKYQVALIELKYGASAYSGFKKEFTDTYNAGSFSIVQYQRSLGSGLLGHIANFCRFQKKNDQFNALKEEMCSIIQNYKDLKLCEEWNGDSKINANDMSDIPQFYIITLGADEKCKEAFERYMKETPSSSKYNVEKVLGEDFTDEKSHPNYHFYFTADDGEKIKDIISDELYEKPYELDSEASEKCLGAESMAPSETSLGFGPKSE